MKLRNLFLPAIVLVPSILIYGMLSLESDKFRITTYPELIQGKEAYLSAAGNPVDSTAPNILWITVDDLSIADTDLYMDGPVAVPNLRKLAAGGVKFTNAYVSSPVCSPSRAAMATGRYNQRFGFEHQLHERYLRNRLEYYGFKYFVDGGPWVPQPSDSVPAERFIHDMGMPTSEIMLPEVLEKQDYRSAYIGKWHIGKKASNSPNAFGYEEFYGFMASHSLYVPEGTEGYVDQKIEDDFTDEYIWEGQRDGLHSIQRNGTVISESRYMTDAITDESIAFLQTNMKKPFHLWASYNAPHTPLQAPEEYVEMFANVQDPVKRVHYAMIKKLDDEIGRLIDWIDDHDLGENTLIMLISDNGGAEFNLTTENGPYQGGKITNFEGGVKVPMLMRWSGVVPGGMVYESPVHATDLFMTSVVAAGGKLPEDRVMDGADLVSAVRDSTSAHDYIYFQMGFNRAVRDANWKMSWNEDNGDTVLFYLSEDPYELESKYAANHPKVAEFRDAFTRWSEHNEPRAWPPVMYYQYTGEDGREYYFDQ